MVLKATFSSPNMLRQIIEGMKDLVKEVNFDCNESGIQVQSMDSSNVAMVHLLIKEVAFETYECSEPVTLGLNVESLSKILKMCGLTDRVILSTGGKVAEGTLRFEFISSDDGRIADFEMKSMSIEAEPVGVPESAPNVIVTMPSSDLKKAVTDLKEFGDALKIVAEKDGVRFNASGDIGTGNVLFKPRTGTTPEDTVTLQGDATFDHFESSYGMRYLHLFTRASGLSKTCNLVMQTREPFRLRYHLEEEAHGFIEFLLAPKQDE